MLKQFIYLGWWFVRARFFGRRKPLQSVVFISDRCNLQCKHCSVYQKENAHNMSYEDVRKHLLNVYASGSRFVDFEGGEVMLWRDGSRTINDLIDLAREIGFFSVTITTNAQLPFEGCKADSLWVSVDGLGAYHDAIRGEGTFARLEKNLASCGHDHVSINMAVNKLNVESLEETIRYAKDNAAVEMIAVNFHTPFPGTEYLALDEAARLEAIDKVIEMKKAGYPIMNSVSGLRKMRHNNFKNRCWITKFVYPDGSEGGCVGETIGLCGKCGFCMAGEMASVFNLAPDTIFAGLKLRM